MKKENLSNFKGGWVVGDFSPSLFKNKDCEIAIKYYQDGDLEKKHVHKLCTEITIVVAGRISMNNTIVEQGEMLILEPNEACEFKCLSNNTITVVIKNPSIPSDKYFC